MNTAKTALITVSAAALLALAACTPDREGEMGRVDPQTAEQGAAMQAEGTPPPSRQLQDALAACEGVTPSVSREQCEAEARRMHEGATHRQPMDQQPQQ